MECIIPFRVQTVLYCPTIFPHRPPLHAPPPPPHQSPQSQSLSFRLSPSPSPSPSALMPLIAAATCPPHVSAPVHHSGIDRPIIKVRNGQPQLEKRGTVHESEDLALHLDWEGGERHIWCGFCVLCGGLGKGMVGGGRFLTKIYGKGR